MNTATRPYVERSDHYLTQATEEFEQGDYLQASEKAWGAAAQIVKAVAEERGRRHGTHRRLRETVESIDQETDDFDYVTAFKAAEALHGNFYEGFMLADAVQKSVEQVTEFVQEMRAVLTAT